MKVKSLDYDFSKREVGFLLVIILLLAVSGFATYRIYRNKQAGAVTSYEQCVAKGNEVLLSYPPQCTAGGETFTQTSVSFSDDTGTFSITYPTSLNLVTNDAETDQPSDLPIKTYRLLPLKANNNSGLDIMIDKTGQIKNQIKTNWQDNGHVIESRTIGNYQAEYAKVIFNGDAEQYVDDSYLVYNGDTAVYFTYREQWYHEGAAHVDNSAFIKDFEAAINSIKFL